MKDVYNHKGKFENWKARVLEEGIEGLTKENSDILLRFIQDLERGINTGKGSKKGARCEATLNKNSGRLTQEFKWLQDRGIKNVVKNPRETEKQIQNIFNEMRKGDLKTNHGEKYKSIDTYVKVFIAFWNWWIKVNRKEGIEILKITEDLDASQEQQPPFVYITKDQLNQILPYFTPDEQVILLFCYDSLIRSPTELLNLKVKDVYEE